MEKKKLGEKNLEGGNLRKKLSLKMELYVPVLFLDVCSLAFPLHSPIRFGSVESADVELG